MKITEDQIAEKKLAGMSKHGPVVYVLTKGGLHSLFSRGHDGNIVSLAAAPHKAIMTFFAEKKEPSIKWREEFLSKSENDPLDLMKAEQDNYQKYRTMFWSQGSSLAKSEVSNIYFVYNVSTNDIWVSDKESIKDDMKSATDVASWVVRPIDLTEPPKMANLCEDFNDPIGE